MKKLNKQQSKEFVEILKNTYPDASTEWWDTPSATYGYVKLN